MWDDRISEAYYGILGEDFGQRARERINWMASRARGESVLDVGCSQGITSILLAREGFRVVGIDISPEAIAYAQQERDKEIDTVQERLTFRCIELAALAEESFDTVILGEVVEHVAQPARLIQLAAACLAVGGRMVITTPFGLHPYPDHKVTLFPQQLADALAPYFRIDVADVRSGYIYLTATRAAGEEPCGDSAELARRLTELTESGALEAQRAYEKLNAVKKKIQRSLTAHRTELETKSGQLADAELGLAEAKRRLVSGKKQLDRLLAEREQERQTSEEAIERLSSEIAARKAQEQAIELRYDAALKSGAEQLDALIRLDRELDELGERSAGLHTEIEALKAGRAYQLGAAICASYRRPWRWPKLLWAFRRARPEEQSEEIASERAPGSQWELDPASPWQARATQAGRVPRWLKMPVSDQRELILNLSLQSYSDVTEDGAMLLLRCQAADGKALALPDRRFKPRAREQDTSFMGLGIGPQVAHKLKIRLPKNTHSLSVCVNRYRADAPIRVVYEGLTLSDGGDDAGGPDDAEEEAFKLQVLDAYREGGTSAVVDALSSAAADDAAVAAALLKAAGVLVQQGEWEGEYPLATAALERVRNETTLRAMFWIAQRAQKYDVANRAVADLENLFGENPNKRRQELLARLKRSPVTILSLLDEARPTAVSRIATIPNRFCYVLHNSLPYSSGGYATRSHGVVTALKGMGWDPIVLSRPGFPLDIKEELTRSDVPPVDLVDDIPYLRTFEPLRLAGTPTRAYVLNAAAALEHRFREYRPALVVAASNYLTALPALIAARRVGVPFVYEIRGFWEITRLSREPGYVNNGNYHVQRKAEASVANEADHAFTLTEAMRDELVERGVPLTHIDLLPNSCDPSRFQPLVRDESLADALGLPSQVPVIGYIGTFVQYEGLENLASACALLKQQGIEFRLLLVGNENTSGSDRGPITEEIQRIAELEEFRDWVIMPGRVPHEDVERYYSIIDIAPFPRKPQPVCEMVSPMKPLEALAMEKAVVVSSVRALQEMIKDNETGLVFAKGEVESLAATLRSLIEDPALRVRLGKAGRRWVEQERTWAHVGQRFTERCATFETVRLNEREAV